MSEFARRRIAALLLATALLLGALAVLDVGPFDDGPPGAEDQVAAKVQDLYRSASAGEFGRFCALLTPRARTSVRQNAAALTGQDEIECEPALEATLGNLLEGTRVGIEESSVSGPRARVVVALRSPGEQSEPRTVYLEEIDGEWLVSDPG